MMTASFTAAWMCRGVFGKLIYRSALFPAPLMPASFHQHYSAAFHPSKGIRRLTISCNNAEQYDESWMGVSTLSSLPPNVSTLNCMHCVHFTSEQAVTVVHSFLPVLLKVCLVAFRIAARALRERC